MPDVGSIARNFHEGSRSEYLAQYIFSGFGTSVPVPHQEDSGFDLYATLVENRGRRSWPLYHYTVQVKSSPDPWPFQSPDAVKWLVNHPHPLFLCVLDKRLLRFSLYHTFPRFVVAARANLLGELALEPGEVDPLGTVTTYEFPGDRKTFTLGSPIIEATLSDLANEHFRRETWEILASWLRFETDNLARVRNGLPIVSMPARYWTNQPANLSGGGARLWNPKGSNIERFKLVLREVLPWLADHLKHIDDLRGSTLCALLISYLSKSFDKRMDIAFATELRLREMFAPDDPRVSVAIDFLNNAFNRAYDQIEAGPDRKD